MLRKLILTCFLAGLGLNAHAQDKITMTSGAVQQGAIVRVDANTLTLHMAAGDIALARKDIAKVEIQKPAEVDAALKAVETKKYAEAIPVLKAVTEKYMNLAEPWLEQAYGVLGDSQAATGQAAAANETFKKLLAYYPQSKSVLKAKVGLAQGLANEKKYDEALQLLEPAVEPLRKELTVSPDDNRFLGSAMIVLGDCYLAKGDTEKALDSYLSTVVLYYRDPEAVKQAQQKADALKEKMKSSA
jgi:tetratricopeptide (TPR) repeat protein